MTTYYGPFNGPMPTGQTLQCITTPSAACDTLMQTFCAANTNSAACACINSPFPCATASDPGCSNSGNSYKPFNKPDCTDSLLCNNVFLTNGNSNVVETTTMMCTNAPVFSINFYYVVLFLIIVIVINYIIIYIKCTTRKP
jgi:hypothetical protein